MASTFTIPQTTLAVGSRTFGPANAADTETAVTLTIDRTVAGGLNSLTPASTLGVDLQQSNDGGVTWQDLGGWQTTGGTIQTKSGGAGASSSGRWNLIPGTSRQLRATVTVSVTSITVAGTIVTQ